MAFKRGPNGEGGRKRGYDAVDDGHNERRDRGHPRSYEEPGVSKIRRLLFGLVDKPKNEPSKEAHFIAARIHATYQETSMKESLFPLLSHVVLNHPAIIPVLSAIVLHVNNLNSDIAAEIVRQTGLGLQYAVGAGEWVEAKLLLRFLACMQGLFTDDGMVNLLGLFFQRAVDLQEASPDDTFGLELVKIILLTIPYLVASGPDSIREGVAELLEQTAVIASAPPSQFQELTEPYLGSDRPTAFQPVLALLQNQLTIEAEGGWKLAVVPRPYQNFKRNAASETETTDEAKPVEAPKVLFPDIELAEKLNPGKKGGLCQAFLSIYVDAEVQSVPRFDQIASVLVRDVLVDTITLLDYNRIWVSEFLVDVHRFWPVGTFAPRKTQLETLKTAEGGTPTWKSEDMMVDAVFSQLMTLPRPPHKLVYYHSLITETCKVDPAAIAPSLGRAIRFFYRNVGSMDRELEHRFMDWFAHHLSNYDFRWKWAEWVGDVSLPDAHPHKSFLMGVLDKEVRLSFPKRIRETLPLELYDLVPEGKDEETPPFKFRDASNVYATEARELLQLIKRKATDDEIEPVVEAIKSKAAAEGADPVVQATDIYVACILYVGSKSLSHVLSAVERHKQFLLQVGQQSEHARQQIIGTTVEYWHYRPGTAVGIVDKFLNYTIVTPASLVEWAAKTGTAGDGSALASHWLYEMVSGTMGKVINRLGQIRDALIRSRLTLAAEKELAALEDMFRAERERVGDHFSTLRASVESVIERNRADVEAGGGTDEAGLVAGWAVRWQRVFGRQAAVVDQSMSERGVELGLEVEEMIEAAKRVEQIDADDTMSRIRQAELASKPVNVDQAPITEEFDPTNGMECDVGPGSASMKVTEPATVEDEENEKENA